MRNVLNAKTMFCTFDKDMTSQNRFLCNYFQVTVKKISFELICSHLGTLAVLQHASCTVCSFTRRERNNPK